MWIYAAPFGAFLFLTGLSRIMRRRDMLVLVGVAVAFCVLLAGLRTETDNDWATYRDIFKSIPSAVGSPSDLLGAIDDLYLEPVFVVLVSLVKVPFTDLGVFVVIAALSLWIYYSNLRRVAKYPATAFLMYIGDGFYLREFTQLRFGLAVALGFASLVALLLHHRWKHRWLALLATSMHYTGIVLFAAQAWLALVCTRRRVLLVSTVLLVMSLLGIFDGLVNLLADAGLAPLRLLSYIESEEESAAVSQAILLGQYVLLLASLRLVKDKEANFGWVSLYALGFALLCIFSGFDLMRRLSFFFTPALYVLASLALAKRCWGTVLLFIAYATALLVARFSILQPYGTWL